MFGRKGAKSKRVHAGGLFEESGREGEGVLPGSVAQVGRGQVIMRGHKRLTVWFPTPTSCFHTRMKTISPRERNRNSKTPNFIGVEEVGTGSRARAPETSNQVVSIHFANSSETWPVTDAVDRIGRWGVLEAHRFWEMEVEVHGLALTPFISHSVSLQRDAASLQLLKAPGSFKSLGFEQTLSPVWNAQAYNTELLLVVCSSA